MGKDNLYNVGTYSDTELYQILDVNEHVSDRELEAKILYFVKKYSDIGNDAGEKLVQFFVDIYNHFFMDSDDDNDDIDDRKPNRRMEGFTADTLTGKGDVITDDDLQAADSAVSQFKTTQASVDANAIPATDENGKVDKLTKDATGKVTVTSSVPYARDNLNPLLKQSTKRIVSIDSQYRENKKTPSTNFTFNLSEPLRDVVSLKLYSVQIPYTWYTVNNSFGGNFFTIRGAVVGINDGNHDYKVEIKSGNYSPDNLVSAINDSIQLLSGTYPDVDFGDTEIKYDSRNTRATLNVDITKIYDESNYYLEFPGNTLTTNPIERARSLAIYLGYNYNLYNCFSLCSARDLPMINNSQTSNDNTSSVYLVDASNHTIQFVYYSGETYATKTATHKTIDISLLHGVRTRNALANEFNLALKASEWLDISYSGIERIDISNVLYENNQKSFFKINAKLNRMKVKQISGAKLAVIFPDETYLDLNYSKVWSGNGSCFRFLDLVNDLHHIVAETVMKQSNYNVVGTQQIRFLSTSFPYNTTFNSYNATLVVKPLGYTLTEYLNAINDSIAVANAIGSISNNLNDLNLPSTNIMVDEYNHVELNVDINRVFRNKYYRVEIQHDVLGDHTEELEDENVSYFQNVVPAVGYSLKTTDVILIIPNTAAMGVFVSDISAATFRIVPTQTVIYASFNELQNAMNNLFFNYTDSLGDKPLVDSTVDIEFFVNPIAGPQIRTTLNLIVRKTLTQLNYGISFYDSTATDPSDNLWTTQLYFDSFYSLSDYEIIDGATTIVNNQPISDNQITVETGVNDYFFLKPYPVIGLYTQTMSYSVRVEIPAGVYSRNTLYTAINNSFATHPLAHGSRIQPITRNGLEYTMVSAIINQTFTTKDFSIVYFDPINSITNCGALKNITAAAKVATWDSTIGWLLGFHDTPIYLLADYTVYTEIDGVLSFYTTSNTNMCSMTGDTSVSVNLFNYLLIVLDDYTQNHLNDGLVTMGMQETQVDIPADTQYVCDPVTNELVTSNASTTGSGKMTLNAIYAQNQKLLAKKVKAKSYSTGPFVKDVFGIIPVKTTGLANGAVYVEFGGTLQNQERMYFGPVNIHRMTIKLLNDRGDLVDLNNANWSFSLMCEQLYKIS